MRSAAWVGLVLAACAPPPETLGLPDPSARLFATLDRDGSGWIARSEIPDADPDEVLAAFDTDEDGGLDRAEVVHAMTDIPSPPPEVLESEEPERRHGKAGWGPKRGQRGR